MFDFGQSVFVVELLTAALIFMSGFRWRSKFGIAFLPVAVLVLFSSLSLFRQPGSVHAFEFLKSPLYYTVIFLLFTIIVFCIKDIDFPDAFIVCVASYAAQHISYDIFVIITSFCNINIGAIIFTPLYWLLEFLIYGGCYLILYYVFGKQFKIDWNQIRSRKIWLGICFGTLILVIFFNLLYVDEESVVMQIICHTYDLFCTVFCLSVLYFISQVNFLRTELDQLTQIWKLKQDHYTLTKENIELINIKCHDIRKQIQTIYQNHSNLPAQKMLNEIENSIQIYDATYQTGNDALDVILTEKSLFCQKNKIQLKCLANGKELDFMELTDLYSLFGNIIDNAIESVLKCPDPECRIIDLQIRALGNMLHIQEENYCTDNLTFVKGLPVTTKKDTLNHGFGMKSISLIVKKYNGNMSILTEDHIFHLNIVLLKPKSQ
jgi:hypothetical protein